MIDYQKITEDLTPYDVCRYLGIKTRQSGKNIFIRCPAHEKVMGRADKNIGNCILGNSFRYAFKCFSCGAYGSVLDLIAYEMDLDVKKDFREILTIAAKATGHENDYIVSESPDEKRKYEEIKKKKQKIDEMRLLCDDEFETLGLNPHMFDGEVITECIGKELIDEIDTENYKRYTHFEKDNGRLTESTVYLKTEKKMFDIRGGSDLYKAALLKITDRKLYAAQALLCMSNDEIRGHFKVNTDDGDLALVREQLKMKEIELKNIKRKLESLV